MNPRIIYFNLILVLCGALPNMAAIYYHEADFFNWLLLIISLVWGIFVFVVVLQWEIEQFLRSIKTDLDIKGSI